MRTFTVDDIDFKPFEGAEDIPDLICTCCGKKMKSGDKWFISDLYFTEDAHWSVLSCSNTCSRTLKGHGDIPMGVLNNFIMDRITAMAKMHGG